MAQHARLQILLAAVGVDQLALLILCHGIDGEVAPGQVLLQRDVWRGVDGEAVVAMAAFSLGPGQCVLFFGLRVEEDWKVFSDRHIAQIPHVLGGATYHDPVPVAAKSPQQMVTHCATNKEFFHSVSLVSQMVRFLTLGYLQWCKNEGIPVNLDWYVICMDYSRSLLGFPFGRSVMKRFAVSLGLALSLAATGASAADVSGSFASSSSSYGTLFSSDAGILTGSVLSSFTGSSGYDIFTVLVDGVSIPDLIPAKDDYFYFSAPVAAGLHSILVSGKSYGGSFVGAYEVTSVPEPTAVAMALAGVGLVVSISRRRLS